MTHPLRVAYFTMEIGLKSEIPTFAGGLGMLAADLMRSAADLNVAAACVSVRWQEGYLRQSLLPDGSQRYEQVPWDPTKELTLLPTRITVDIERHPVTVGVWRLDLTAGTHVVPVYFLDTDVPENRPEDRLITKQLYGGDGAMRLRQELVLGIGGVRMLRALGHSAVTTFHMNEGHAAFLTLELLRERSYADDAVRASCVFTTHTPVPAGHDIFGYDLAWAIAGDNLPWHIRDIAGQDALSMTTLAMRMSRRTFAVSRVHRDVSRRLLQNPEVDYITNGVHPATWASPEIADVLDSFVPGWQREPRRLERSQQIPDAALWTAHQTAKQRLIDHVNRTTGAGFDVETLTIASARRIVPYKRPELLYTNLERLREVGAGKLQIIHAGNAHPHDPFSQEVIRHMVERARLLHDSVKIVYLPNYGPDLARVLVGGADVWLNTPMRLHEASGTSGMKAALNGVLNLSTLDGWWIEGYERDPDAGWRIGPLASALHDADETLRVDAEDLYTQLQYQVIPHYLEAGRERWLRRMKRSIALLGQFSSHRAIEEYLTQAWPA
jgi:starch phosphorylase